MKHIELHILQSVPVSCLNRDDLNSPKTAIFGGVQRARVSSQCWKRAIREMAKEESPDFFNGMRTRNIIEPLTKILKTSGLSEAETKEGVEKIVDAFKNKIDTEKRVKTLVFTTTKELELIANEYAKTKDAKKAVKAGGKNFMRDAADIALFGRMVADDQEMKVEGVSLFSHAISTHKVDNEIDYFTAVDDFPSEGDSGAAMASTLEFNSATYYRFAALNLDMFKDQDHLGSMSVDERRDVVKAFIKSTLMGMPGARKGSMNGNTLPGYVLCVIREKGHPIQLVNAFEKPVFEKNGVFEKSVERLKDEYKKQNETWDLVEKACIAMPEKSLNELLTEAVKYVD
jgi:CRISPR system Cascade subunit CasC